MFCQSGSTASGVFASERCGATRTGYHSAKVFITVGGVHRAFGKPTSTDSVDDLTITESTSATPNRASFTARGFEPTVGMEVIVQLGSKSTYRRLFAGTIMAVKEANIGSPSFRVLSVECVDWTWSMNRYKVLGHYTGTADEIAIELMTDYAPDDFTTDQVQTGLDEIEGGITFTNIDLSEALGRLAKRARHNGGSTPAKVFVDYYKDLYFRVDDTIDHLTNPVTLVSGLSTLRKFSIARDLSQMITRVSMEGGGAEAATDVEAGETILPLTVAPDTWYSDVGGVVISGPQTISYTGRFQGLGGAVAGPAAAPNDAPTLALASGTGVTTGEHDVTLVFKTGAGTTLPGPPATIEVGTVSAPEGAPVVGIPTTGTGPDAGAHQFAVTFVTDAGETTASPLSAIVTTTAPITAPGSAPVASDPGNNGIGSLTIGHQYKYKVTFGDAFGNETTPSSGSNTFTITSSQRAQVVTAYSTDPRCTRIYLYRSENGGAGTFKRVRPALSGGSQFDYFNNNPAGGPLTLFDISGVPTTAAPTTNTAATNAVPLSGIPIPPADVTNLVLGKNVYGTAANASQLKLIATIAANQTDYIVTTADADLGANVPTSNTAAANQIDVVAPLGPTGTTERRFYMSLANVGGARKLALTIANNTETEGTITASDATLSGAGAEPSTDTSGLSFVHGYVVAGATECQVAGLGGEFGFQSTGGWAIVGNGQQAIRYTGTLSDSAENFLTGIPATGTGSIQTSIQYGSQITACPALTGIGDVDVLGLLVVDASRQLRIETGTPTDRLGMGFIAPEDLTVPIGRVELMLGGDSPGDNVWITIQSGSISPAGTVLGTSELVPCDDAAVVEGWAPTSFEFTTPVELTPGDTYYVVLHGDFPRYDIAVGRVFSWGGTSSTADTGLVGPGKEYDGTSVNDSAIKAFAMRVIGAGGEIIHAIHKGDPVNLFVTVDDTVAQATFADLLGDDSDGVKEAVLQDRRLSRTEALARARAHLDLRSPTKATVNVVSKDMNNGAGRTLTVNLTSPTNVTDTFDIQSVTISNFSQLPPDYTVQASNELVEALDVLSREP